MDHPEQTLLLPDLAMHEVAVLGACRIIALTGTSKPGLDYALSDDAVDQDYLEIREVSHGGHVPSLSIDNRSDQPVLILEGDILVGGKQNRMCNSTVMAPGNSSLEIPVSCVESRRWRYNSRKFRKPRSTSSIDVLRKLKSGKFNQGSHSSNQAAIWQAIEEVQRQARYSSPTDDHGEVLMLRGSDLQQFLDTATCPTDAIGLAVILGARGHVVDIFDRPTTCQHYWRQRSALPCRRLLTPACQQKPHPPRLSSKSSMNSRRLAGNPSRPLAWE